MLSEREKNDYIYPLGIIWDSYGIK